MALEAVEPRSANHSLGQEASAAYAAPSPKWRYVYFLLAAFDLVTVCAGLYLNHEIMAIYTQSVAVNRIWAERVAAYSHLGELAAEVDAPGNDVFDNRDVVKDTARMRAAEKAFDQNLATQRDEMNANLSPRVAAPLLRLFDAISLAKIEMTGEAERIFEYFKEGRPDLAGERMATMDHKYAHLNSALLELRQAVSAIQEQNFNEQTAAAAALQRFEYLIGLSIVLMVIGATYYGHKIAQQMQADADERERNFKALRAVSARTRSILDAAAEGIVTFDRERRIESFNKAAETLFGYASGAAIGRDIASLIPALADPAGINSGGESVGRRQDGSRFPLELSISAIDLGPEPLFTGIVRDITDRRKAEEALRMAAAAQAANHAKSQFLAKMSHEIRTPMNGVLGMTEMLLETKLSAGQRRLVEIVSRSGETLLGIIDNILDFSKIEAGKLELECIEFNPRTLTQDTTQLLIESAEKKNLRLVCQIADEVPHAARGEPLRLRQVLTNLIGNAIKFTDRGEVVVRVSRLPTADAGGLAEPPSPAAGTLLRFEVADTGIGIGASVQQSLFQAFTQADNSTTRRYGGTGLGLAISKDLVERMGGEIGVLSTPGQGSTFWFSVRLLAPLEQGLVSTRQATEHREPERAAAAATARLGKRQVQPRPASALHGIRVLLAEDNLVNQEVIRTMLESLDCQVCVADNGAQALTALEAATFDIVFMDRHMPEVDGFDATRQIRAARHLRPRPAAGDAPPPRLPVVALTASALKGDREICLAAGMDDYVSKPFTRDALRRVIERWVLDQDSEHVDTAAAEGMPPPCSFDRSMLDQIRLKQRPGAASIVAEMIDRYLAEARLLIESLARACAAADAGVAGNATHALRISSDFLGARKLAAICHDLERAALRGELQRLPEYAERIEEEYAAVQMAVQAIRAER